MRLHGRNAAQWWRHDKAEDRYDYLYSAEELKEFVDTADAARRLVKKLYLYTNNHFSAKSVANAAMIKQQLGEPIEGEYPPEFVERYPELADVRRTASPTPVTYIRRDDVAALRSVAGTSVAFDDLAEHGVLRRRDRAALRQRDVDLAVGRRPGPGCAIATAPSDVQPLLEISATPIGLPLDASGPRPQSASRSRVARLRIAALHDETRARRGARADRRRSRAAPARRRAPRSWAPRAERLERERALGRLDDDDHGPAASTAPTAAADAAATGTRRLQHDARSMPAMRDLRIMFFDVTRHADLRAVRPRSRTRRSADRPAGTRSAPRSPDTG